MLPTSSDQKREKRKSGDSSSHNGKKSQKHIDTKNLDGKEVLQSPMSRQTSESSVSGWVRVSEMMFVSTSWMVIETFKFSVKLGGSAFPNLYIYTSLYFYSFCMVDGPSLSISPLCQLLTLMIFDHGIMIIFDIQCQWQDWQHWQHWQHS